MSSALAINRVEHDANRDGIDAVTVFQTDRAEVKRRIKIELKDGQNDVEVKNLPTCLLEDSIRVDGIGNATIFDVVYHPPLPYDQSKNKDSLLDLYEREGRVKSETKILKRQANILSEYSATLRAGDSNAETLENFLDVYADRQRKIDQATAKLYTELININKEISERRKALDADEESVRKRGTRVTIVVLADGPGLAELSLTYVVTHAWWLPHYDLRAFIANDAKNQNTVSLHYRASISQKTGEDWTGVQLTLSTASPLLGTEVPRLDPYQIGPVMGSGLGPSNRRKFFAVGVERDAATPPRTVIVPSRRSPSLYDVKQSVVHYRSPEIMHQLSTVPQDNFATARVSSPEPPNFFRGAESRATDGAVSTTFAIPGLSTIPSDSDKEQQTHKVSIAELNFNSVDLEWITVPKDIPSIFLRCKVQNISNYVLLPGQANIFLNGSFVAKSSIAHVSQQESFSCSLGVDPAIRVTYHPQTKKTRTTGGNIIGTKTKVVSYEQKITIRNTRLSRIPCLLVKDQIFVSLDARVKVTLLEPKSLAGSQKGGKPNGKVTARWSSWKDDKDLVSLGDTPEEIDIESAQGMLEWICAIEPSGTVHLNLAWEISAPVDIEWRKQ